MKKILTFAIAAIIAFTGYTFLKPEPTGVALPEVAAVFETSLQSPITSSATTMTLTANSIRGGGSLSGFNCFTVDEGSSNAETICGTVSGTSVTSLERGISQANGTTTVSALQFSHRRGANVKITDFPIIQRLKAQNNGEDSFENVLVYNVPKTFSTSTALVDKNYVDNLTNQGAATSSETVAGIAELATQIEMASSTDLGSQRPLVLQAKYATSSPGTAGLWTVITNNAGKIAQGFIDLAANYTWTGLNTFNATTTFNSGITINTQEYYFPSSDGTASSTVLSTDSNGNLSWNSLTSMFTVILTTGEAIDVSINPIAVAIDDGVSAYDEVVASASGGLNGCIIQSSNAQCSQSFIPLQHNYLKTITMNVIDVGTANNYDWQIDIYNADINHKPTGSSLGTDTQVMDSIGTTSFDFVFSTPINLVMGNEYVAVIKPINISTLDSSNYHRIKTNNTDVHTGYSSDSSDSGVTWATPSVNDQSYTFKMGFIGTGSGRIIRADANDNDRNNFLGFVNSSVATSSSALVTINGVIDGFTGLSSGVKYYLSDTIGNISTTPGTLIWKTGVSVSNSSIIIQNQEADSNL